MMRGTEGCVFEGRPKQIELTPHDSTVEKEKGNEEKEKNE
jgi:hypothetical protein